MDEDFKPRLIADRHLGQFKVRADLLRDNVGGMLQLMANVIIVQATFDPLDGCFTYIGYSQHFPSVEAGLRGGTFTPLFASNGRGKFLGFASTEMIP